MFAAFGPEPTMQVYGRGLRRRLPPMLDGDPRRIRMVYSLLFSLPGTPVLFYGEEIGMGENLDAPGRLAVRTPMQWTGERERRLLHGRRRAAARPGGERRLRARARQRRRPAQRPGLAADASSSCWSAATASAPSSAGASVEVLDQPDAAVLAHRTSWDDASVITVHNSPTRLPTYGSPTLPAGDVILTELAAGSTIRPDRDGSVQLRLEPYGHSWLRVTDASSREIT